MPNSNPSSRRSFLKQSAVAASALAAGCAAPSSSPAKSWGIIDAHVHVWTPNLKKYPLWEGYTREDMKPPSFTPEQLFAHCQPEGVDRIVLIQMSYYRFDNSYMLDCMERFPGVFGAVGIVDWFGGRPDADMARLAKRGVRGFRVTNRDAADKSKWIETPGFERMFKHAADNGLSICALMGTDGLPSLSRMCEKHPDTRVVIDHFCRIGVSGQIEEEDVKALEAMAKFPNTHVKVSAFYALGKKAPPHDDLEPMIKRMHAAFGAKRLMWASDCPFAVDEEKYADSLSLVRDRCSWLGAVDRDWLLRRTAEKIFYS
ncbi:MAG: putative TIM-barrel fold metal-dependent hydrolase [Candidatus Binatia bacterium]|jgi:predicted TIM-barrel fold metal-dependent hydrolase